MNGEPGEFNTVVDEDDVVEVDGQRVEKQPLHYVLLNKPAGVVTTADDPHGRPTVVDLVSARGARGPGRSARRGHDGCAAADERRGARTPVGTSELRGSEGLRSRHRGLSVPCGSRGASRRDRARRRSNGTSRGRVIRRGTRVSAARADLARGSQAPGEAHVRCGRPPRAQPAPKPVRRACVSTASSPVGGASSRRTRYVRCAGSPTPALARPCAEECGANHAGRTKPMRSYMASSVGADATRALSAPTSSRRRSSASSARSSW